MKFLVIAGPSTESAAHLQDVDKDFEQTSLNAFDYYDQLAKRGKLEHYVRMDGPPGSVLIFNVDSEEEFATLRSQDPLIPLMGDNIKVIPLADPKHAREFMSRIKKEKDAGRGAKK